MNRGEVFLARLDPSEGSEQAGTRPVVIVSRDAINRSSPVIIVVPLTSWAEGRRIYPSQVSIHAPEGGLGADSIALGEQVRAIARNRLVSRWGALEPGTVRRIDRGLLIALGLPGQFD